MKRHSDSKVLITSYIISLDSLNMINKMPWFQLPDQIFVLSC